MIVFANPCTGKTQAIYRLKLGALEINNANFFNFLTLKKDREVKKYINQIIRAEEENLLFSMYLPGIYMDMLLQKIEKKRVFLCGFDLSYKDMIKENIKNRKKSDILRGASSIISDTWGEESTIEKEFKEFLFYHKKYPECNFIQLMPGEYLADALERVPEIEKYIGGKLDKRKLKEQASLLL